MGSINQIKLHIQLGNILSKFGKTYKGCLPTTFQDVRYNPTQSSINHDHPHSCTNILHLLLIYFVLTVFVSFM